MAALDVPIRFLGCFDTVGALGVPKTGLLTPMKWTPKLIKHLQFRNTALPRSMDPKPRFNIIQKLTRGRCDNFPSRVGPR
jgi:hypothetical protein